METIVLQLCGYVSGREVPALEICLDHYDNFDIIIFTMIRSRKPDAKLRALEENGTANPHAQDVQDAAFADGDFFDRRDLVQVRYEMLRRVRKEGHSVAKATALFGVSRPTFYKVQRDFDHRGLVGLLPTKRGPHGPHKITPEVLRFIEEAIAAEASLDAQDLAARIAERFGLTVHRRTVERALARFKKKPR
jgi:transposase